MKTFIPIILLVGIIGALAQSVMVPEFVPRSAAESRALIGKALALKAGDSFQTVTNALGSPDPGVGSASTIPTLHYSLWSPNAFSTNYGFCAVISVEAISYVTVRLDPQTQRVSSILIKAALQ